MMVVLSFFKASKSIDGIAITITTNIKGFRLKAFVPDNPASSPAPAKKNKGSQ
jgi:hypothetical protein